MQPTSICMKRPRLFILLLSFLSLLFTSCGKEEQKAGERSSYIIPDSLLKTLVIDTVAYQPLIASLQFNGIIDAVPDKVSNVFPLISGNVQDAGLQPGDYVRKGQALGEIQSPEMAGYVAGLISAAAAEKLAEQQLNRTKELAKSSLAADIDVTQAEVNYRQSVAAKEQAEKVLGINGNNPKGHYTIKAPEEGFITQKNVTNGMAIRTDNANPLYTIADLSTVWVLANVYEANISKVHEGDEASIATITYPNQVFKGKVTKLMNTLDPSNRVMKMRIAIPNPGYLLKPQMFATITVNNRLPGEALAIPARALVFDNSQYYAVVYQSARDISLRPVELLSMNGNTAYIKSGLQAGEKLIGSNTILIYTALNN